MKLSFTLLFAALAPAAKAIDFFPNLRGIAVEVAEEAERRYGKNGSACKGYEHKCSTAADSHITHRCCAAANAKVLTCAKDSEPDAENPQFDGTCIESSGDRCHDFHYMEIVCEDDQGIEDGDKCVNHWAAPPADANCTTICNYVSSLDKHICVQGGGEEEVTEEEQNLRGVVGIALTTGEERYGRPIGIGPCRKKTEHCDTSQTTLSNRNCCDTDPEGKDLICVYNETVRSNSVATYDGVCTEVAASAPGEIDE